MPRNNINERLPDGSTILHNAVKKGNEKLISLLIQQEHSVHIEDAEGKKPLDYAPTEKIKKMLITAMQVDQTLIYSSADKYFNDLKNTYITKESDKEKAIDVLFSDPTIKPEVAEVVMQKIWSYNVTGNNEVAAPIAAPIEVTQTATTTTTSVAPTATTIVPSEASMEALNDIKARLSKGDNIEDIIASLEHYGIENEIKDKIIQHIFDYVSGNSEVVAPAEVAPIATSTTTTTISANDSPVRAPDPARYDTLIEPVSTSTDEKFSAEVKVRLYNGEDKDDLINFVLNYLTTNEDVKSELIDYIYGYTIGTELAGQIGTEIQF